MDVESGGSGGVEVECGWIPAHGVAWSGGGVRVDPVA